MITDRKWIAVAGRLDSIGGTQANKAQAVLFVRNVEIFPQEFFVTTSMKRWIKLN